jgi:predicted AAA+ superfamily ATPase
MKTLEACYEIEFHKINFLERKTRITHPKTILTGPPKCGKSYLIYDYLSNFKSENYLYIDLSDLRNNKEEIAVNLATFIKQHPIKVLVLEEYNFDFDFPLVDSIVITSSHPKSLKGFKLLHLNSLDFEEFLLHDNKHQNITNTFNHFFKYGNLPEIIHIDENKKIKHTQDVLKTLALSSGNLEIIKVLFESIDEKKSIYQLFTTLKNKIKISKDSFYALCKHYEHNQILFFIEKYNQPKAVKKLYCYNHSFLSAISHTKKFKNEFTNMVFLELHNKYKEIYYLESIDFYIKSKKCIIFSIPFFNEMLISTIKKRVSLHLKECEIKEVYIITIANTQTFFIDTIKVEVRPFYEWALS